MKNMLSVVLFSMIILLCGCSRNTHPAPTLMLDPSINRAPGEQSQIATSQDYIIGIGDVIHVKFFYNPELNQEDMLVRPDGRISLPYVDDIPAAGLSPKELDKILTERYSKVLKRPEVSVIVKQSAAQRVYVGGEVGSPGVIDLSGKLTVFQAVLQRGGFKKSAELKNIVLLRDRGNEEPAFMTINLKDVVSESKTSRRDVLLMPHDVIFVPKTTIAELDQFVDEYIKQLIPVTYDLGFSFLYNLKPRAPIIE